MRFEWILLAEAIVSRFDEIVIIIRITLPASKVSLGHRLTCTHDLDLVDLLHDPQAVVAFANRSSSMSREM